MKDWVKKPRQTNEGLGKKPRQTNEGMGKKNPDRPMKDWVKKQTYRPMKDWVKKTQIDQ